MAKSFLPLLLLLVAVSGWSDLVALPFTTPSPGALPATFTARLPEGSGGAVWLVVPPVDRPLTLEWQGHRFFETGDPAGKGRSKTMASQLVLPPADAADRELVLTWYGPGSPPTGFLVGTRDEAAGYVFLRNALGPGLTGALVVTALVLTLAIGLLLVFSRGTLQPIPGRALLAANLCFIVTWLNLLITLPTAAETPLAVLTHWGLTGWSLAGVFLALEFTGAFRPVWRRRLLQWAPVVLPGLVWLSFGSDPAEVVRRYNLAVAPLNLIADLITGGLAVAAVVRRPSVRTWSFALIAVPSMVAAFHDIWWFVVVGQRPYMQLLPSVGLILNLYFVIVFFYDASKLYRRLQDQVTARTHDLERFVGLLSHDLRNVVQGIHGAAELLADPATRPPAGEGLDRLTGSLRDATREARAVLGTLLKLSQVRTGALVPQPVVLAADELWKEACRPWLTTAAGLNLRIETRPGGPLAFLADREMTLSILRNLVDNAVRHASSGGRVGLSVRPLPGGAVGLTVENDGARLSPEALADLFDWSQKRLRGDQESGAGFGLVLCRDLAERQGFRLTAEAQAGGNRFTLEVPARNVLRAAEGKPFLPALARGPKVNP